MLNVVLFGVDLFLCHLVDGLVGLVVVLVGVASGVMVVGVMG